MSRNTCIRTLAASALVSITLAAPLANAETCFSAFTGTVHYNFSVAATKFATPGTFSAPGVVFGSLSACAGLSKWPIIGTATVTKTSVVLAFRAMTVDATSCGATDDIVTGMTPASLSGTLQLDNLRTNFGNTSAFAQSTCTTPPPKAEAEAAASPGVDAQGN